MTTTELLNGLHKNPGLLKAATVAQLQEVRDRFNAYYRRLIDEEIASRGTIGVKPGEAWPFEAPLPARGPDAPSPWRTAPDTYARHLEEEETIHGVN